MHGIQPRRDLSEDREYAPPRDHLAVASVLGGDMYGQYPLVALGYVWTLIWSRIFFNEPLTRTKFLGLGTILVGIVVLNLGNR